MSNAPEIAADDLQHAQQKERRFAKVYRAIPDREGGWRRGGNLVRIKLVDLEAALPPGMALDAIRGFKPVAHLGGKWVELAHHIDMTDGSGRWRGGDRVDANTLLCFHAPREASPASHDWPGAGGYDGRIDVTLWDSRGQARLEGVAVYFTTRETPAVTTDGLRLETLDTGIAVMQSGRRLVHFARDKAWQIDWACAPGGGANLVPADRVWRWLLTETTAELGGSGADRVTFEPYVETGPCLVIAVRGESAAGRMAATLRVFLNNDALVLEFSDYQAQRTRTELPPAQHPRSYAGQYASPYPGLHFAALALEAGPTDGRVVDHLYKYQAVPAEGPLVLAYDGERKQRGWSWMAIEAGGQAVGITAHGRTHYPDHPFKAGRVDGRVALALEPFGSEVDGHYRSCDRYMMVLARDADGVREAFDTLDTYPLLASVPLRRGLAFLDTYDCLRKWVNLNLDHLMAGGRYRNAIRTDGTFVNDADTCLVAVSELIRLHEKTGHPVFADAATRAARFVSQWLNSDRVSTRGMGVGANGGGIYQNELIYLLLGLARVYRHTGDERLKHAIDRTRQWMLDQRGVVGTWGWKDYLWHCGGWGPDGKPLYHWPVNTNQFATLNFRLYQLLGDRKYYDAAMEVIDDYLRLTPAGSHEFVKGGGVSDTTRGVHLFAEALEVAGNDPRIDPAFWRGVVERTQDRFWVEGWPMIHHSIYGEAIWPGDDAPHIFSPGFHHWHNCGSHLDLIPRIAVAAEIGVSEHLTRWALKDLAYDFDARFGLEEHTHLSRFSMRDTGINPASWLDCEMLPALYDARRRGWIGDDDFRLLHYKVHRMVQRTFIALGPDHGGWAAAYDSDEGAPIKYLSYWEHRHAHEAFAAGEPLEAWGVPTRDAFYDHSSHYWNALEQLIDEMLVARTVGVRDGVQTIRLRAEGLGSTIPGPKAALVAREPGSCSILIEPEDGRAWRLAESRVVRIAGLEFWLLAAE